MIDVRLAAARVLLALDTGDTTLGAEVARARDTIEARDSGLLVELTTGVLRWRNELDVFVAAAAQRAVKTIDREVLAVLRLGAYQLRHLDRVPPHAVVSTSVDTIRRLRVQSAAGFVNATLRALLRRQHAIALPKRPGPDGSRDAQLAYLSVTLSHPRWLVTRWLDRLGFETAEAWCRFNNQPPDVTVRALGDRAVDDVLARLHAEDVPATLARFVTDAIVLPPGALGRVSADLRSSLFVQDEGAQLIARLAGATPGERVLDACASPGGKSLVLATDLQCGRDEHSQLIAADYRGGRVALLAETMRRSGRPVGLVRLDGRQPLPFREVFDAVLLDAPCTGLGTLRRDPDLKWTRREQDIHPSAIDAGRMLDRAATVVRPGGRLVYATCSSEPEENDDVVDAFLARQPAFEAGDPRRLSSFPSGLLDADGRLRTDPVRHGLEVFFGAVLVRRRAA